MKLRRKGLWLAALLTVAASLHAYTLDPHSAAPIVLPVPVASAPVSEQSGSVASAEEPPRVAIETPAFDPFYPPPAPPPPPLAPVVLAPPPPPPVQMPYQFMGRIAGSQGQPAIYLSHGEEILVAEKGRVLEGLFHVDDIAAERIVMTHVPTGQKTELAIPRASEPTPTPAQ